MVSKDWLGIIAQLVPKYLPRDNEPKGIGDWRVAIQSAYEEALRLHGNSHIEDLQAAANEISRQKNV